MNGFNSSELFYVTDTGSYTAVTGFRYCTYEQTAHCEDDTAGIIPIFHMGTVSYGELNNIIYPKSPSSMWETQGKTQALCL